MELRINPFNPRPCYVEGCRALCHGMDARSGYAMVERGDGSVEMVRAERVRFTNSPSFFDGYRWEKRRAMTEYIYETNRGEHMGLGVDIRARRRERIVRCRDCRRSFEERGELWCRGIVGPPVEPDGFCAWGGVA